MQARFAAALRQILQLVVSNLADLEIDTFVVAQVKPLTLAAGAMARLSINGMPAKGGASLLPFNTAVIKPNH